MHRTLLPKIHIIIGLFAVSAAFGQSRHPAEVSLAKCWSYAVGARLPTSVFTGGQRTFIGFSGADLETIGPDGKKLWSVELGGEIRSNVVPTTDALFVITSTANADKAKPAISTLRALSSETGITTRTQTVPPAENYFLYLSDGSLIVVSGNGVIEVLVGANGTSIWKREIAPGFAAKPAFGGGKVTVATTSNQIFVVSLSNGEIESIRKMPFAVTSIARTAAGELLIGDERGGVQLFAEGADKPRWKFKTGGSVSVVTGSDGNILAVSNDNFLYLINDRSGDVVWKKRLAGRAAATAVYQNKYVVVAGLEEHEAMILDISNGKVAGQMKLADEEVVVGIQTTPTSILILTTDALYSYSIEGCTQK